MAAQQQLNPSAGNITVETLYTRDLTAVTGVHLAAFPDSVLTTLGSGIVKRYYEWQMRAPYHSAPYHSAPRRSAARKHSLPGHRGGASP